MTLKEEIIQLNKEGKPNNEIEIITGAKRDYIKLCISRAGLQSVTLKSRAIELKKNGMSTKDIAERLGCSINTLKGYFSKEGLVDKKRDKEATQRKYQKMYNMYVNENKSIEEIAKEFNFGIDTCRTRLCKLGALKVKDKRVKQKSLAISNNNLNKQREEVKISKPNIIKEEKPYEKIDDETVIYNGKIYRILDKEELRYLLHKDLKIKRRKGRHKKL